MSIARQLVVVKKGCEKMIRRNTNIRIALLQYGVAQNRLAELLGYSEWHFSKLMNRKEFSQEEQERIISIIKENRVN